MTLDGVRARLRRHVNRAGGMAAWCREHGVSHGYLSEILSGSRLPGPKVLAVIGVELVERRYVYRTIPPTTGEQQDHG